MSLISFDLRCASAPDNSYKLEIEAPEGDRLINLLELMAKADKHISKYIFNLDELRLYPYHIIFVDEELLLPKDLDDYIITNERITVKVLPFVSGG